MSRKRVNWETGRGRSTPLSRVGHVWASGPGSQLAAWVTVAARRNSYNDGGEEDP
jgi:hypothetical protein